MAKRYTFSPNRKSVFYRLFASNIIMLMLPILAGAFLYAKMENLIYDNAYQANQVVVNQFLQGMDSRVKEIQQFASQISINPKILSILEESAPENPQKEYLAFDLMSELRRHSLVSSIIDNYFISINRTDSIASAGSKTDTQSYYENELAFKNMSFNRWKEELLRKYDYQSFYPVQEMENHKRVLTFVQSLPIGERVQPRGKLFILVDQAKLLDSTEIYKRLSNTQLYVLDSENRVLMSSEQEPRLEKELIERLISSSSGSFDYQSSQENIMVSFEISKFTGWKYVALMPREEFIKPIQKVKSVAITAVIACILFGLLIAHVMANRNYSPLQNLLSYITLRKKHGMAADKSSEWDVIKQSIDDTLEEEKYLRNQLQRQIPVIQSNYVSRLIRGRVDGDTLNESSLEFVGLQFEWDRFGVLLIDVEDCNYFVKDNSERQWAHVRFIIGNILRDLLADKQMRSYAVDLERDQIGILVNHTQDPLQWKRIVQESVTALTEILSNRFSIFITVAVSDICSNPVQIGSRYSEAQRALDYKWIKGNRSILFFGDLTGAEKTYFYPVEVEGQMINLVKNADHEQVIKLLEQVYAMNFSSGAIAPELGKWLMYNIVSTLLKCLQVLNLQYRDVFPGEEDPDTRLVSCITVHEMFEEIKRMYTTFCKYLKAERSDRSNDLLQLMVTYIQEHVYDAMLGLVSIADHFQFSPQYVSKFFKTHTGQTISDYIAKIRVEEAKKLLKESDLTIMEISQRLGYSTDIGLLRIFKKHEGITPGRYRAISKG